MSDSSCSALVEEFSAPVSKASLSGIGVIAAIDRGCSLTKVLYSTELDADQYNLHFALFRNKDFEQGLLYLKQKGMIVQDAAAKLHVTGAGCDKHSELIRSTLGLDVQFIDELMTQSRGTQWLLQNLQAELLFHPQPPVNETLVAGLMANRFLQSLGASWRQHMRQFRSEETFPCCLVFMGSAGGILKMEADGSTDTVGSLWMAGVTLLGMSKLILDTDSYEEILELAARGNRSNVDTQVKDMLADDANSPYGAFPKEMALFSFGKFVGSGKSASDFKREDIARSLVYMFASNTFRCLLLAAKAARTLNFYLGGNFFRHPLVRTEILQLAKVYCGDMMNVRFLRTGHTGAVGAMISQEQDVLRFMRARLEAVQAEQQ